MTDGDPKIVIRAMLIRIPEGLKKRVHRYATTRGLTDNAASIVLLEKALDVEGVPK